jgi:secretion/DNA translocation related CpaE-like protein
VPAQSTGQPTRPLVVTSDAAMLDDLLRCAGTAGTEVDVVADVEVARPGWTGPPLVIAGGDQLPALARAALPRRPALLVVTSEGSSEPSAWDVAAEIGAESVLTLPAAEPLVTDRLAAVADLGAATTVAVVPGRGGAGATTLACALARMATAVNPPRRALLLDADPLGGGLDLAMGAESVPGLRWGDLAATRGATGPDELRSALPTVGGLTVLAWPREPVMTVDPAAAASVLAAARRGQDLVVADVPRQPGVVADAVLAGAELALLVVPADVRSVAAAAVVAARVASVVADVRVVVRGPAPSGLTGPEVAAAIGFRYAGWLAPEPGLAARVDRGEPPAASGRGHLAAFCRALLAELPVGAVRGPGA